MCRPNANESNESVIVWKVVVETRSAEAVNSKSSLRVTIDLVVFDYLLLPLLLPAAIDPKIVISLFYKYLHSEEKCKSSGLLEEKLSARK